MCLNAVDRRIAGLEKEAREAEDRLRRLYTLIETGLAGLDSILKERIEALKLDRERTSAALDRAKEGARQRIEISPALIEQFGCTMREKLSSGDNAFRKTNISANAPHSLAFSLPCIAAVAEIVKHLNRTSTD